jgi:hypothetical protein
LTIKLESQTSEGSSRRTFIIEPEPKGIKRKPKDQLEDQIVTKHQKINAVSKRPNQKYKRNVYDAVKASHPGAQMPAILTIIAVMWSDLSDADKQKS